MHQWDRNRFFIAMVYNHWGSRNRCTHFVLRRPKLCLFILAY